MKCGRCRYYIDIPCYEGKKCDECNCSPAYENGSKQGYNTAKNEIKCIIASIRDKANGYISLREACNNILKEIESVME